MIVETCINLSIKVVKFSRKMREYVKQNELLRTQMEQAIEINNDFVNQRENVMNISLELMDRQLNDLTDKITNELKSYQEENKKLKDSLSKEIKKQKIEMEMESLQQQQQQQPTVASQVQTQTETPQTVTSTIQTKVVTKTTKKIVNNDDGESPTSCPIHSVRLNYSDNVSTSPQSETKAQQRLQIINDTVKKCRNDITNTNQRCSKIIKLDQKNINNIKKTFDKIKENKISSSEINDINDPYNQEDIHNKEHFEVLKRVYQETCHKLFYFQNALKKSNTNSKTNEDSINCNQHFVPIMRNKQNNSLKSEREKELITITTASSPSESDNKNISKDVQFDYSSDEIDDNETILNDDDDDDDDGNVDGNVNCDQDDFFYNTGNNQLFLTKSLNSFHNYNQDDNNNKTKRNNIK
jgi:hypothetical protein